MNARYRMEMSAEQAELVVQALDFYDRMMMGQFDVLRELPVAQPRTNRDEDLLRETLDGLKAQMTTLPVNASSGESVACKETFNMRKALEQFLSFARCPEGGWTVNFDGPMPGWWVYPPVKVSWVPDLSEVPADQHWLYEDPRTVLALQRAVEALESGERPSFTMDQYGALSEAARARLTEMAKAKGLL